MIAEDQVCSLHLAKKLKEMEIQEESLFVWISVIKTGFDFIKMRESFEPDSKEVGAYSYPAFTASELMNLIPSFIDTKEDEPFNGFRFNLNTPTVVIDNVATKVYSVNYHCDTMQVDSGSPFFALKLSKTPIYDIKLSNALAKLMIYLIENNYVR